MVFLCHAGRKEGRRDLCLQLRNFCEDFRALNSETQLDGFPLLQAHEILEALSWATVFSSLNLHSGYWQVEMHPDSIPKTAFITKKINTNIFIFHLALKMQERLFRGLWPPF